jgi:hypothetical protein
MLKYKQGNEETGKTMIRIIAPTLTRITRLIVALLLVVSLGAAAQTNAAFMSCRSDPIAHLSDGTLMQFSTTVETSLDNLIEIRYELHAPAGVSIEKLIFTPAWASQKETVVVVNDQPVGSYKVVATVQTTTPNVPVKIKGMRVSKTSDQVVSRATASGVSGQPIVLSYQ